MGKMLLWIHPDQQVFIIIILINLKISSSLIADGCLIPNYLIAMKTVTLLNTLLLLLMLYSGLMNVWLWLADIYIGQPR